MNSNELTTEIHDEVWKSLEESWNALVSGDTETFLKFYDQTFKGYRPETPFPVDKVWLEKWLTHYLKSVKFSFCHLTAQSVQVFDEDLAAVMYGVSFIEEAQGEKQCLSQRHAVVMRRKTKRWAVVMSHSEIVDQYAC